MGYHYINELRPSLVQVAQQPACFDFPRRHLPDHFHYTGPWIDDVAGGQRNFPWDRLDGRPMIYASLTNDQPGVAARIRQKGVGEFIPIRQATAPALRQAVLRGLTTAEYRERARHFAAELQRIDGPGAAAALIETAFATGQRVRR